MTKTATQSRNRAEIGRSGRHGAVAGIRGLSRMQGRAVALAAICALGMLSMPGAASAQQQQQQQQMMEPEEVSRHGDWGVQCFPPDQGGQRHCEAVQIVAEEGSDQPLLRVAVGKAAGSGRAILQFIVPLGTQLQRGYNFSVDGGAPTALSATTCLPFGCIVEMPLDSNWLNAMRRGAAGSLSVVDLRNQEVALPISLTGFTAATGEVL